MLAYKGHQLDLKNYSSSEGIIEGYGSVFRDEKDSDGDIIVKGAYKRTLADNASRIKFLGYHDMSKPIGKFEHIEEDDYGLRFKAKISNTQLGNDMKILIEDGVLNEFSVGFIPMLQEYNKEDNTNYIKEIKLFEISLVTLAADDQAVLTDYKEAFKSTDDIINDYDRLIDVARKLKDSDSRIVIEYELRRLKQRSLNVLKSVRATDEKEVEEKQIVSAIDNFLKKI